MSKCVLRLDRIEQMKAQYFSLIRERNRPGISVEEVKENEEKMRQLDQRFYKETGRLITDD